MGNSVSSIQTCSEEVSGNPEAGCEALTYQERVKNGRENEILEHSPTGVSVIRNAALNQRKIELCSQTDESKQFSRIAYGKHGIHFDLEEGAQGPSHCSSASFGLYAAEGMMMQQELLTDVVFAVFPYLEGYFFSSDALRAGLSRSVSFSSQTSSSKDKTSKPMFKLTRKLSVRTFPEVAKNVSTFTQNKDEKCGKQLTDMLQKIFGITENDVYKALEEARKRQKPKKKLVIEVIKARNLRLKVQKDPVNLYCLVKFSGQSISTSSKNCSESFKTSFVQDGQEPRWNESFYVDCEDIQEERVSFEIWQIPVEKGLVKLAPKGFRMETRNLLGCASVDFQEVDHKMTSFSEWLKLTKSKDDNALNQSLEAKKRGELYVKIGLDKGTRLSHREKQKFAFLLSAIASSHGNSCKNKATGICPWNGDLTSEEKLVVESYCVAFRISPEITACTWWSILSLEEMWVDQKYLCSLASHIQNRLEKLPPDDKEHEELMNSIINWMNLQIVKLKDLLSFYPPSSGIHSQRQLTFSLRTVKILEENMSPHLLNRTSHPFNICISEALQEFLKSWWENTYRSHRNVFLDKPQNVNQTRQTQNWEKGGTSIKDGGNHEEEITLCQLRATNYSLHRSFHRNSSCIKPHRKRKKTSSLRKCESFSLHEIQRPTCIPQDFKVREPMECKKEIDDTMKKLDVAARCVVDVKTLLEMIAEIYNNVFYREFTVPFFRKSFVYLSDNLESLIQPLLRMCAQYKPTSNIELGADPLALEIGTPAYEIFKSIARMERLGESHYISCEPHPQSRFKDYWKWLSQGVDLWLNRTFLRAKQSVVKDVEEEQFEEQCDFCSFSTINMIDMHHMILDGWQKLEWPAEKEDSKWIMKIGDILVSLDGIYALELKAKLYSTTQNAAEIVSKIPKMCVAASNLMKLEGAVEGFPHLLETRCPEFPLSSSGKEVLIGRVQECRSELKALAAEILEEIVTEMGPSIVVSLVQSAQLGRSSPFLDHLSHEVKCVGSRLQRENFKKFIFRLWTRIVNSLLDFIERHKRKQKHTFFLTLFSCLEGSLQCLKSESKGSLNFESLDEYEQVRVQLTLLSKSNEALTCDYYLQRLKEQKTSDNSSKLGEIILRTSLDQRGILNVNVILGRDLYVPNQPSNTSFRRVNNAKTRKVSPNTLAHVRLVPSQMFCGVAAFKTKIQKKSTNPVYDATFEFPLGNVCSDRVKQGYVLVSIYCWECLSRNQFIGEALFPLRDVTRVNVSNVASSRNVRNSTVKITKPNDLSDYDSLNILKLRTWDKSTSRFLRDLHRP